MAIPTVGVTPRDSLTAQMILLDSLCPRIEGVVPLRERRPEGVLGRERVVEVVVKVTLGPELEIDGEELDGSSNSSSS